RPRSRCRRARRRTGRDTFRRGLGSGNALVRRRPRDPSPGSWQPAVGSRGSGCCVVGLGGCGGAQPGEWLGGEDHFYRYLEVLGDAQRQVQARAVLAALEVADRLVVHPERVGQLAPGDPALGPQHGDPVVDGLAHGSFSVRARSRGAHYPRIVFSRRAATLEPDSRRAIRRSTTGASTSPAIAHAESTATVAGCRQEWPTSTTAIACGSSAERIPSPSQ